MLSISRGVVLSVVAMAALGMSCKKRSTGEKSPKLQSSATGKKVLVEMYVMSKCPYGVRAVDGIVPALKELGNRVTLKLDYIADTVAEGKSCRGNRPPHKGLCAMHGKAEVEGNMQQLCAMKHYPQRDRWLGFISCQNRSWQQIPNNWEQCAKEQKMDVAVIKKCVEGDEGANLHRASSGRAQTARAAGSPTIFVAGSRFQSGERSKESFMRAICNKMEEPKHGACASLPKPVEVLATVVTDKRCEDCDISRSEQHLRNSFLPKLKVRVVDYSTDEGKKLFETLDLKVLPAWLMDKSVEKAIAYKRISRWLQPVGDYLRLNTGAKHDPTAEICNNKIDDTGNGKVDCADPTCFRKLACRKEQKRSAQVFVMSQCPYGVKAIEAMKELINNFGKSVKFDIHYIADDVGSKKTCPNGRPSHMGFCALHGPSEVKENIRQLCAKKHYRQRNRYLKYIWCRNKNYRSDDWKGCAREAKLDVAKIERCFTGPEGRKLHEDDIKEAKALGFSASPTWMANNQIKFSGIDAESIKKKICQHNKSLKNCDKTLTKGAKVQGACGE